MGLKEISRTIQRFVGERRAFLDVNVGPRLANVMLFDDDTVAYPLGSLGNQANIDFGIRLLRSLGIPTDQKFVEAAQQQGAPFYDLTVIVYAGLEDEEFEKAACGLSQRTDRCRALLSLYTGGNHIPILRFKWTKPKLGETEFLAPPYRRGVRDRAGDDPISPEFVKICATECYEDDQLHYFISMIEQIYGLKDETFMIARYYSLLEAMAGGITSQFVRQSGNTSMTRKAIRFMIGYFSEFDIPRFTITPDRDFEFDHIELAGRVRDKLFHGGGKLAHNKVPAELRPGVDLLTLRPDMICHRLRRDCELEIVRWTRRESRGWLAQNGTNFDLPMRDPDYDGRELTKPLISGSPQPGSAIGSVYAKVDGTDIGIVRLNLQV